MSKANVDVAVYVVTTPSHRLFGIFGTEAEANVAAKRGHAISRIEVWDAEILREDSEQ